MWSGSSITENDEWIELKNMTDRTLDITGLSITRLAGGADVSMIPVSSFVGKTIAPYGYFLLSHFVNTSSKIKDTVIPNIVDSGVNLSDTELEIKLYKWCNSYRYCMGWYSANRRNQRYYQWNVLFHGENRCSR